MWRKLSELSGLGASILMPSPSQRHGESLEDYCSGSFFRFFVFRIVFFELSFLHGGKQPLPQDRQVMWLDLAKHESHPEVGVGVNDGRVGLEIRAVGREDFHQDPAPGS